MDRHGCPGCPITLSTPGTLRVFGLLVDPEVLADHRDDRRKKSMSSYGMNTGYSNMKQVVQELEDVQVGSPVPLSPPPPSPGDPQRSMDP